MIIRKSKLFLVAATAAMSGLTSLWCMAQNAPSQPNTTEALASSFVQPPDDARPMVRWWWFGPAVTKPQLEREMNYMKQGGFGGFEVEPIYPLALDGERPGLKNLPIGSPEFYDALKFTAAKAKELGLRMDLTLGSGWPYGGPEFPQEQGATAIANQMVNVAAGTKSVPLPGANDPGAAGVTQARPKLNIFAAFVRVGEGFEEAPIKDGEAQIPANVTGDTQLMFVQMRQGIMVVKRPAVNGEGNVIDHYSPTVVDKFIKEVGEPAIQATAPNYPYAIFCDSLEIGGENWTPNLLEEFKKRRGYDLRPLLPALFVDMGPKTSEIRHDWLQTCTEMFNDNFNTKFRDLAHKYNSRFRIQGYGSPPAALYSYSYVDLPEAEGFNWQTFEETRWASSASHLLGKPVTSSETWTWLKQAVFHATPLDIKGEANIHFLQGINQLIGHGWPYTAEGAAYPGWSMYAAAVFNNNNPWWIVMPDVTKYLQRVSHMMRQGTSANDVLVYIPNSDVWAERGTSINQAVESRVGAGGRGGGRRGGGGGGTGNITGSLLAAGYNLDYFDDQLLAMRGKVDGKTITFGDVKYRAVVLPQVQHIMPDTMKKLDEFAKNGGIVIAVGGAPQMAPGYLATDADQKVVTDAATRLFGEKQPTGKLLSNASELGAALAAKGLAPDVALEPAAPDVGFVHRHTAAGEVYFIANTTNQSQSVKATFRVPSGMNAELWDPTSGAVKAAPAGNSVALDLEPYGSAIVVYSNRKLPSAASPALASVPAPIDLSTGWTVKFGADGPTVNMDKLASWADSDATKAFSGVATYSRKVDVKPDMIRDGVKLSLNLGKPSAAQGGGGRGGNGYRTNLESPVREAAVVYVNDKKVGSVWAPPYSVDLTGAIKAGENQIRIEVGNLAVNYMSAHGYPNYNLQGVRQQFGDRFQPQGLNNLQPLPAGLLGPIQIEASAVSAK